MFGAKKTVAAKGVINFRLLNDRFIKGYIEAANDAKKSIGTQIDLIALKLNELMVKKRAISSGETMDLPTVSELEHLIAMIDALNNTHLDPLKDTLKRVKDHLVTVQNSPL